MEVQTKRGVQVHIGVPVPCVLSFFYPGAVSESVLCSSGASRSYAAVCEREIRGRVSTQSHGEVSPMWQGMHGLCSRRVMSSSWDRSSCDEDGEVFLACFQGDADEFWDARHNSKCNCPFTPKSVMNKP